MMVGRVIEAVVVLCAVVGFYALCSVLGLFPGEIWPLLLAALGSYGCYLYGRYGRRLLGGDLT